MIESAKELKQYAIDLLLDDNLSTLKPGQMLGLSEDLLSQSRDDLKAILANSDASAQEKASASSAYIDASNKFLELSRNAFGSGQEYVDAFNRVLTETATFGQDLDSLADPTIGLQEAQNKYLADMLDLDTAQLGVLERIEADARVGQVVTSVVAEELLKEGTTIAKGVVSRDGAAVDISGLVKDQLGDFAPDNANLAARISGATADAAGSVQNVMTNFGIAWGANMDSWLRKLAVVLGTNVDALEEVIPSAADVAADRGTEISAEIEAEKRRQDDVQALINSAFLSANASQLGEKSATSLVSSAKTSFLANEDELASSDIQSAQGVLRKIEQRISQITASAVELGALDNTKITFALDSLNMSKSSIEGSLSGYNTFTGMILSAIQAEEKQVAADKAALAPYVGLSASAALSIRGSEDLPSTGENRRTSGKGSSSKYASFLVDGTQLTTSTSQETIWDEGYTLLGEFAYLADIIDHLGKGSDNISKSDISSALAFVNEANDVFAGNTQFGSTFGTAGLGNLDPAIAAMLSDAETSALNFSGGRSVDITGDSARVYGGKYTRTGSGGFYATDETLDLSAGAQDRSLIQDAIDVLFSQGLISSDTISEKILIELAGINANTETTATFVEEGNEDRRSVAEEKGLIDPGEATIN